MVKACSGDCLHRIVGGIDDLKLIQALVEHQELGIVMREHDSVRTGQTIVGGRAICRSGGYVRHGDRGACSQGEN